jgi:hypothetical protein
VPAVTRLDHDRDQRGQVIVMFAVLLPAFLALTGVVVGLGNWFVHAKHLQTKADAGALAGGGGWAFPCGDGITTIDQRIAALARSYAGATNPQVGGVPDTSIHSVLNGPAWYDDDTNPNPVENLDICETMRLDVKVTEDNSFPLASLIPLFPDIKRKAAVELKQTDGMSGLLPVAVRAPKPVTALAIYYDESNGTILARRYLDEKTGPNGPGLPGLPNGLQGWSTENSGDVDGNGGWASFTPAARTGVVIAISFRGACDTWGPSGAPPGITVETGSVCFEDGVGQGATAYTNVNGAGGLCNQGGAVQIANCYFATGTFPNESVQSGLHLIRGFPPATVSGNGGPALGNAHLSPGACVQGYGSGYFTTFPSSCGAIFSASLAIGSCFRVLQNPSNPTSWTGPCVAQGTLNATETRIADNVEVKYTLVHGTGNNDDICDFGNTCDVGDNDAGAGQVNANLSIPAATLAGETRYAVALRVRMQNTVAPNRNCTSSTFAGSCEWYFLGTGRVDTEPNNATIFGNPVQRIFRGDTVNAGSIKWLRLKADRGCDGGPADDFLFGGGEGSHPTTTATCFVAEVGLKGGLAVDADDQAILFNDGVGASQMGALDCTATGPQNVIWEMMNGCPPLYGPNLFNTNPLCPPANNLFATPNPGPPFDVDWPPLRCVKTRPSSQVADIVRGLNGRLFFPNNPNPPPNAPNTCPAQVGNGYVRGRNYWKNGDLANGSSTYGYNDDVDNDGTVDWFTYFDPKDARLVTLFLTTSESFTGSGQNTYPITGAIGVYITGFGRISGNGSVTVDDPCAGPLPSDLDTSGGSSGGRVMWGHFVNLAVLSAGATPSGAECDPGASTQPCVAVLVE